MLISKTIFTPNTDLLHLIYSMGTFLALLSVLKSLLLMNGELYMMLQDTGHA